MTDGGGPNPRLYFGLNAKDKTKTDQNSLTGPEVILADGRKGTVNDLVGKDVVRITDRDGITDTIGRFLVLHAKDNKIEVCTSKNCVHYRHLEHIVKIEVLTASNLLEIIRNFVGKQQEESNALWG
ncbi:MAG: hypothetical protein ABR875_03510 [Minisyncoccia bacterium]